MYINVIMIKEKIGAKRTSVPGCGRGEGAARGDLDGTGRGLGVFK